MSGIAGVSLVFAAIWALLAVAATRTLDRHVSGALALLCGLLAVAHSIATVWKPLAPLVLAVWWAYALALPSGRLRSVSRRVCAGLGAVGLSAWSAVLAVDDATANTSIFVAVAATGSTIGAVACTLRLRNASADHRRSAQWLAAAWLLSVASVAVCALLYLMSGEPRPLTAWLFGTLLFVPLGQLCALTTRSARPAAFVLAGVIPIAGLAALTAGVYLVVVVGLNGPPKGHERSVLLASVSAAIITLILSIPARHRLIRIADAFVTGREPTAHDALTTFGARMSRAVPMDELMLQLAESLHASTKGSAAEIWTGVDGSLTRVVSVPARGRASIQLGDSERVVIGRTRIGRPGWTAIWMPGHFTSDDPHTDHRVVPIAHLGSLLGLLVIRRPAIVAFSEDEEGALVEVGHQLGLAMHNVRLDSALQESLAALANRNEQLQASRLRIVTAADASRRDIERNLHDGAQQNLTALAVKLGFARQLAADHDIESVLRLLDDLYTDVRHTIGVLRDLAHGIYPPLLRDRGLNEALRIAAIRLVLPCSVSVDLAGRYPEQVETAVYFCCLEVMQNAGKYAGDHASMIVTVNSDAENLRFELIDSGAGFDPSVTTLGNGFTNMRDRLGAIGGSLTIDSAPGAGTTVRGRVPARPIERAPSASRVGTDHRWSEPRRRTDQ